MQLTKVMVIEDELAISQVLKAYLKKADYQVEQVFRGDNALSQIEVERPDLVLLDVMLPGRSGWDILKDIRKQNLCPVIMLTALGEVPDRLKGLHEGADDYIAKPFVAEEVVARVQAVLRRSNDYTNAFKRFGSLTVDKEAYTVKLHGEPVELTPKDTSLLLFLADHPNRTFTREQLIEQVWGWDYEGSNRAVDLSVKRLRKALVDWPISEGAIKTIRGLGYQLYVQ